LRVSPARNPHRSEQVQSISGSSFAVSTSPVLAAALVAAAAEAGKKLIKFKIYIKKQEETKC
jgi:hypothetical protein